MADLQTLNTFLHVVKCGSFSAAAEQLGVTPPAVSKSIARLERALGIRLMNRTTRKLHLTSEGRDFLAHVEPHVHAIEASVEHARRATQRPRGLLRIVVGTTFGQHCLIPVLAGFFDRYPEVKVELDFDEYPRDLLEGGFDLCIRLGVGSQATLVTRRLHYAFPVVLVASPQYLDTHGVPRTVEALAAHRFAGAGSQSKHIANWQLQRVAPETEAARRRRGKPIFVPIPRGPLIINGTYYDTAIMAALHHVGIAGAALPAVQSHLQSGKLKIVLPDYRVKNSRAADNCLYIQYPHREHLAPKVRVFVEYVMAALSDRSINEFPIEQYAAR